MSNWLRTYVMPSPGCPLSVLRVKRDLTRGFQKNCQSHMKGLKHKTDSDRRNTIIRGRFAAFMLAPKRCLHSSRPRLFFLYLNHTLDDEPEFDGQTGHRWGDKAKKTRKKTSSAAGDHELVTLRLTAVWLVK
jgi:hypothetical protein